MTSRSSSGMLGCQTSTLSRIAASAAFSFQASCSKLSSMTSAFFAFHSSRWPPTRMAAPSGTWMGSSMRSRWLPGPVRGARCVFGPRTLNATAPVGRSVAALASTLSSTSVVRGNGGNGAPAPAAAASPSATTSTSPKPQFLFSRRTPSFTKNARCHVPSSATPSSSASKSMPPRAVAAPACAMNSAAICSRARSSTRSTSQSGLNPSKKRSPALLLGMGAVTSGRACAPRPDFQK
mmetsp:Transcript_46224/g.144563  ORF Transcript_46224/g.144563 Transcript_46224/m.144563 type:complete len:236 (-) Transcript_46224:1143-1850(-)